MIDQQNWDTKHKGNGQVGKVHFEPGAGTESREHQMAQPTRNYLQEMMKVSDKGQGYT